MPGMKYWNVARSLQVSFSHVKWSANIGAIFLAKKGVHHLILVLHYDIIAYI